METINLPMHTALCIFTLIMQCAHIYCREILLMRGYYHIFHSAARLRDNVMPALEMQVKTSHACMGHSKSTLVQCSRVKRLGNARI